MKRTLSMGAGALAGLLLLIALLYAAVASFALTTAPYPDDPPFDEMAVELVAYLSGDEPALSDELFTERERLHMVDVLALFQGGRTLAAVCLGLGLALCGASLWLGGRRRLGRGLCIGMGLFAGLAVAMSLWAGIDFDGWFRTMHEFVFTNDLWLLDPAESMLIRMLPLDFFIGAVQTIALRFGIGALLLLAAALVLQRRPHELSD